jgi:hypothetical protein
MKAPITYEAARATIGDRTFDHRNDSQQRKPACVKGYDYASNADQIMRIRPASPTKFANKGHN